MSSLERNLVLLGRELDISDAPELAPRVLAQIGTRRRAAPGRRLVFALAVVVLAAFLAALAIPEARSALLRFFDIGGARIELVDELPDVVPPTPGELELTLGVAVSLEEARRRARFGLLELDEAPDRVYIADRGTVWFLYGRPDAVRLLVAQTPRVEIDEPFILKKLAGVGTRVAQVSVRGEPAYFLSGEPHAMLLIDEYGLVLEESARLAQDVLVWEEGGRTIRLEGDLTLDEAVDLADSLSVRPHG